MTIFNIIDGLKHTQVFKYAPPSAVVDMLGSDAQEFLQRMSTNDLAKLSAHTPLQTCLLNNKGRIVDSIIIIMRDKHNFALVSSFADSSLLINWLEQFHFVEDFILTPSNSSCEWLISAQANKNNYIWHDESIYFYINLRDNNHNSLIPEISHSEWNTVRVKAAMPGLAEIQLALMPQNINLAHVIADNKGCYLGQEVVAKAITYQKHVKILKALKLSEEKFAHAHAREKIIDDEGQEAFITSLAPIYVNNWPNILALVNT